MDSEKTMAYQQLPGMQSDDTNYEKEEMDTLEALLPTGVQTR